MARHRKTAPPRQAATHAAAKSWSSLTWNDLDHWAGSRSVARGQAYQRQGRVKELALAEDGRLLATVVGTERYVTSAWLVPDKGRGKQIESACSCPVGASGCKHAVAAVADFLAALAEKRAVPAAELDDRRWAKLTEDDLDEFDDDEIEDDEFDESGADDDEFGELDDEADFAPAAAKRSKRAQDTGGNRSQRLTRAEWDKKIKTHVEQKSREDLAGLVCSLVERFPELRQELQERIALGEGDVDQLLAAARRELRAVTGEFGWRNHWNGEGHTPDYDRLKHRLERLAELGHCDAVVELGRELIDRGMEQVGQSDDEGETATELSNCLPVVFEALAKSNLSTPDKILYAVDACLKDDYDLIGDAAGTILAAKWSSADWSVVADRLAKRLQKASRGKGQDDFSRNYQRDRIGNYLLDALDRAGRKKELLPIYEAEARETGSYQRLVSYLIAEGADEEAERWACEGIDKTHQKLPGIASGLAKSLCELRAAKSNGTSWPPMRHTNFSTARAHAHSRTWKRPPKRPSAKSPCAPRHFDSWNRESRRFASPKVEGAVAKPRLIQRGRCRFPTIFFRGCPTERQILLHGRTTACCSTWQFRTSVRRTCCIGMTK